jgi:hypothetical protein
MSKGTCKQIAGRIIGINFEEQAIEIRPFDGHPAKGILTEPIRFYVNDALFRDLLAITASTWPRKKICADGRFCIQGRVLFHFDLPPRLDITRAFGEDTCSSPSGTSMSGTRTQEENKDTRPGWCKEAEKHSDCFVSISPDERITFYWGHKDAAMMNKAEFTGPCCVAFIRD